MIVALSALAVAVVVYPGVDARRRLGSTSVGTVTLPIRVSPWFAVPAAALLGLVAGWQVGGACAVLAGTVVLRRSRRRARRERDLARTALVSGLDTMVAELNVGAHPAAACEAAAAEHHGAVASRFASAAARARLGGALSDVGQDDPHWDRVVSVWRVSEQYGLGLGALMEAVRRDLDSRARFARRIEAALSGARATATVLAALPVLGVALGQAMGAAPLAVLFGGGLGSLLLLIGVTLACAGLLWTDAIVTAVAS